MLPEKLALLTWPWRYAVRPALFRRDAEWTHAVSKTTFSGLMKVPVLRWLTAELLSVPDPRLRVRLFGIDFPNPVGLAAGLDKDAEWFDALQALGFGFIEVGTLTAQAQPGNPNPRLFRLPADQALLNRMGFCNGGAASAAARLARKRPGSIVGANIGKSAVVPLEAAPADYLASFEVLYPHASYFVLNVSSPNTPGLRRLQGKEPLSVLLRALTERNASLARSRQERPRPLLVKIAPDLNEDELDDVLGLCVDFRLDGIVVANTTTARDGLLTPEDEVRGYGAGGISGAPLTLRSRAMVASVYRKTGGALPVIGVGGIMTPEDAWQMIRAGAALVQVYTGLIYGGPGFVAEINRHLLRRLSETGKASIAEAVGEAATDPAPEKKPNGVAVTPELPKS